MLAVSEEGGYIRDTVVLSVVRDGLLGYLWVLRGEEGGGWVWVWERRGEDIVRSEVCVWVRVEIKNPTIGRSYLH